MEHDFNDAVSWNMISIMLFHAGYVDKIISRNLINNVISSIRDVFFY